MKAPPTVEPLGLAALSVPPNPPPTWTEAHETRGGWVVAWRQMTSTAAIDQAIDWAQTARLDTLFVQVRVSGDAYYRSSFIPRAEALSGQPADFDPLAYALERGHAKGLKVHAYINLGVIWRSTTTPVDRTHVFNAHPEWIMRDATGKFSYPDPKDPQPGYVEENYWVNWGHPKLQEHLARVADEIADKYPVDGIHMDFVRFPARMGPRTPGAGYDEVSVERFKKETGQEPKEHTRAWDEWRTAQVTATLAAIRKAVKARRPQAELSVAALGAWNLAAGRNSTAFRRWVADGLVDFAVLMAYYKDPAWVWQSALNANEAADPRRVMLGLHTQSHAPEALAEEIRLSRELGLKGWALFSLDRTEVPEPGPYLEKVRDLAVPAPDDRYASAEPLWDRVGVIDDAHRSWKLRFYSRTGHSKLVVYPRGMKAAAFMLGDKKLPLLRFADDKPAQLDLTPVLKPFEREVAGNHDFVLSAEDSKPDGSSAQVFVVDYFAEPSP